MRRIAFFPWPIPDVERARVRQEGPVARSTTFLPEGLHMTSFRNSSSYLLTSESVTEGHPDKVCDQVSDAILDAILEQDRNARVACETAVTKGFLAVIGEVTTAAEVPLEKTIRDTLKGIGYVGEATGFDPDHAHMSVYLKEQSQNIAAGVEHSLQERPRGGGRPGARGRCGSLRAAGRRGPGDDDRVRLWRASGADAADHLAGSPADPPARRRA